MVVVGCCYYIRLTIVDIRENINVYNNNKKREQLNTKHICSQDMTVKWNTNITFLHNNRVFVW